MPKTIEQKVKFNIPPEKLFEIYLSSKKHSQACDHKTYVSRKVGANFSVPPYLSGENLAIVPKKMIVQAWRESDCLSAPARQILSGWQAGKKTDLDSILILTFSRVRGQIHLAHANLPDKVYKTINRGWRKHYWNPWRVYIEKKFKKS